MGYLFIVLGIGCLAFALVNHRVVGLMRRRSGLPGRFIAFRAFETVRFAVGGIVLLGLGAAIIFTGH